MNGAAFRALWRVESRLDVLAKDGYIDEAGYYAACRFRAAYEQARGLAGSPLARAGMPRGPGNPEAGKGTRRPDPSELLPVLDRLGARNAA